MRRFSKRSVLVLSLLAALSACSTFRDHLLGGEWEVSQVEQDPAVLYLHMKNSGSSEIFYVASKLDAKLLKALLRSPEGYWYLPLGRQGHLESTIDEACDEIQSKRQHFPGLSLVEVTARYPALSTGVAHFKAPFRADELISYGALYSRIRYPADDSDLTVTDAIVSCRDPAGKRFAMAQQRVALDFLLVAGELFAQKSERYNRDLDKKIASRTREEKIVALLNFSAAQVRWNRFHLAANRAQLEWMTREPMGLKYYFRERFIEQIQDSIESSVEKDRKHLAAAEADFQKLAKKFKVAPEKFLSPGEQTLTDKDFELFR